eukprot:TRINITY_DN2436_c1_g1_i3.p2 TRINITY_DN2436_c1_g1~~TRINITY_DN2436_c1_g1_i3.p2  ORF type:complete len:105 (-),score=6.03 TRINITY_DN2436_c1_g1_i3:84-398(-)
MEEKKKEERGKKRIKTLVGTIGALSLFSFSCSCSVELRQLRKAHGGRKVKERDPPPPVPVPDCVLERAHANNHFDECRILGAVFSFSPLKAFIFFFLFFFHCYL